MRKFLLATHGSFSAGIKTSLEMITGSNDNIFIIEAYTGGNKSIEGDLEKTLKNFYADDELIVFTDLAGGSITSEIMRLLRSERVHVVAGMNLPLLLEIVLADPGSDTAEVIENGINSAREQIMYVSKLLKTVNNE